ncbi:MAG: DUF2344 domain-containing protein [Clostridia bacterium]|nr:DUF2344 domain-containing protein [Clostridia bacterium]
MSKWRVVFSKMGMGKYISHLDLLRCFTRAIQRSGLPVVYSQGFNPHQKMTFSLPLPIGVTSECETVDIQFEDGLTSAEIQEKLNQNLPMDMKVLAVHEPTAKAADIVSAEYQMGAMTAGVVEKDALRKFFGSGEVLVTKKTKKKGEKQINLMDYLHAWEVEEVAEDGFKLRVVLDAGGERNLKPDILASAMGDFLENNDVSDWEIHRRKIFWKDEKGVQRIFD